MRWQTTVLMVGCVSCGLALGGCRAPAPTQNATSEAPGSGIAVKPAATKALVKGTPPKTAKTAQPGKVAAKPTPAATMTVSQEMGVGILKAINADPGMAGHKISVGTGPGTVWLDGSTPKASQKALAEKIAKSKTPQAKVVNRLTIGAPVAAPQKAANLKPGVATGNVGH